MPLLPDHLLKRLDDDAYAMQKDRITTAVLRAIGVTAPQQKRLVAAMKVSATDLVSYLLDTKGVATGYIRVNNIPDLLHPIKSRALTMVEEVLPGATPDDVFQVFVYDAKAKAKDVKVWVIKSARSEFAQLHGKGCLLLNGGRGRCTMSARMTDNMAIVVCDIASHLQSLGIDEAYMIDKLKEYRR